MAAPPSEPDEDAPVLARIAAGEVSAYNELAVKYRPLLFGLARRYVKSPDDAEDVTQRALLRAFEKLSTFRRQASFRSWLCRIAVHIALNHVRDTPRAEPVDVDDIASFTLALDTGKMVKAELWRKVAARLEVLPQKQRLAVELRFFHDLSFKEIAALSDCSESSAKSNYQHGIRRLRDVLER